MDTPDYTEASMKTLIRNVLATLAAGALLAPAAALAGGPEVFNAQSCNRCHSVTAAGIQRAADKDETAKDLSTVGARYDKQTIARYLLKKVPIDGEKHKVSWNGTPADLKILAEWLESLK